MNVIPSDGSSLPDERARHIIHIATSKPYAIFIKQFSKEQAEAEIKVLESLKNRVEYKKAQVLLDERIQELNKQTLTKGISGDAPLTRLFWTTDKRTEEKVLSELELVALDLPTPKVEFTSDDPNLMVAIHGDVYAKDTGYEGLPNAPTLFLANFLKPPLKALMKQAHDIEKEMTYMKPPDFIWKIKSEIEKSQDKHILIPTTWKGGDFAHATLLEIQKTGSQYTVRFYNTGEGLIKEESQIVAGKRKNPCYVELQEVEELDLFNPLFWQAILEMKQHKVAPGHESPDFNDKDMSVALKMLKGKPQNPQVSLEFLMSPQRGGTCAWRSLMAFLRHQMPLKEYKHLKWEIKVNSLLSYFSDMIKPETIEIEIMKLRTEGKYVRKILENAAKKMALEALKLNEEHILTHEELSLTQHLTDSILDKLEAVRKLESSTDQKPIDQPKVGEPIVLPCSLPTLAASQSTALARTSWQTHQKIVLRLNDQTPVTLQDIANLLPLFEELKDASQYDALLSLLYRSIERLPLESSISPSVAEEAMQTITKLTYLLCETLYLANADGPERQKCKILATRLTALQWHIFQGVESYFENQGEEFEKKWAHDPQLFGRIIMTLSTWNRADSDLVAWSKEHLFGCPFSDVPGSIVEYSQSTLDFTRRSPIINYLKKLCDDQAFVTIVSEQYPEFRQLETLAEKSAFLYVHAHQFKELSLFSFMLRQMSLTHFIIHGILIHPPGFTPSATCFDCQYNDPQEPDADEGMSLASKSEKVTRAFPELREAIMAAYPDFLTSLTNKTRLFKPVAKKLKDPTCQSILARGRELTSEGSLMFNLLKKQKLNMPFEETRELLSCAMTPSLQPQLILQYFIKYTDKLELPDFQTLLQIFLFEGHLLQDELARNPSFAQTLQQFCLQALENAYAFNHAEKALFFISLSRRLENYCQTTFFNRQEALNRFEDKFHPVGALLGHFLLEKSAAPLPPHVILEAHLKRISLPLPEVDPILLFEAKENVMQALEKLLPDEMERYSKALQIALSKEQSIPETIRRDSIFIHLFGEKARTCKQIGTDLYELQDQGITYRIQKTEKEVIVFRSFESEKWWSFIPPSTFTPYFTTLCDSWAPAKKEDPFYFTNRKSKEIAYVGEMSDKGVSHIRSQKSHEEIAEPNQYPFELQCFEVLKYVTIWQKDNHLTRIELPRLGLIFDENLACNEFPGFVIAKNQTLPKQLQGIPGGLVLENQAGEKKILVHRYHLKFTEVGALRLKDAGVRFADETDEKPSYATYTLPSRSNEIIPSTLDERYFLAFLQLSRGNYEFAASNLIAKSGLYSEKEHKMLKEIIKNRSRDFDPNASAVRLYASYLLLHNWSLYGKGQAPWLQSVKTSLALEYSLYLQKRHNIYVSLLTLAQERFIAHELPPTKDPLLIQRCAELIGEGSYPISKTAIAPMPKINWSKLWKQQVYKHAGSIKSPLLTRPGNSLILEFHSLYESAKGPDNDKRREYALRCAFGANAGNGNELASIFSAMMHVVFEHPQKFPPREEGDQFDFMAKVKEIADSIEVHKEESLPAQKEEIKGAYPPVQPKPFAPTAPQTNLPFATLTPQEGLFTSMIDEFFKAGKKQEKAPDTSNMDAALRQSRGSDNPLVQAELDRLREDAKALKPSSYSSYTLEHPIELQGDLRWAAEDLRALANEAASEIVALGNKEPETEEEKVLFHLKRTSKVLISLSLDDLLILSMREDIHLFQERNPYLRADDITRIKELCRTYLLRKTEEQQATRALRQVDKRTNLKGEAAKECDQEIVQMLSATRAYDPNASFVFLLFEYYADLLMREDQVQNLDLLLKGDKQRILQMIMGSGKTKVFLVLLSLLRAFKDNLSMVIVPEALFEQTSADMSNSLHGAFRQSLASFDFDRNTQFTVASLTFFLETLEDICSSGKVLLMTSKSLQSLYLKYFEALEKNEEPQKIALLSKILLILKTRGDVLIDEADFVLNCRHEVNFTMGKKRSLDDARLNLCCQIHQLLQEEFPQVLQGPFIQEKYPLEAIANRVLEKFFPNMDASAREALMNRVPCKDDLLALAKFTIHSLLPLILSKNLDEHYGLSETPGELLAIPYLASNTPSHGMHFGNPYEIVNYTILTYLKKGISKELIEYQIKQLQNEVRQELEINHLLDPSQSKGWQRYLQLIGDLPYNLFQIKEEELQEITMHCNQDVASKLHFLKVFILPTIMVYDDKLSSNPQNTSALFKRVQGFSGTLGNSASLPPQLSPEPVPGTDSKTLAILWQNSNEVPHITLSTEASKIINEAILSNAHALIDTAGLFKGVDNEHVARLLLARRPEMKGIVFYDKSNRQVILHNNEKITPLAESPLREDERFTFYDQRHTVGSDIRQDPHAIAVITIGKATTLRDLLQGAWRLRRLDKGQRIKFLVSDEVGQILQKDSLSLADILYFCIQNQALSAGDDNFLALKQKMDEVLQEEAFKELLSHPSLWSKYRHLFIKDGRDLPAQTYGTVIRPLPAKDVIEHEIAKRGNHPNLLPLVDYKTLPATLEIPSRDDEDTHVAVEVAQEMEVEVEMKQQEEWQESNETHPRRDIWGWEARQLTNLSLDEVPIPKTSVEQGVLNLNQLLATDLFSPSLRTTSNLFSLDTSDHFLIDQKIPRIVAILRDRTSNQHSLILMDQRDASELLEAMQKGLTQQKYDISLNLLSGPVLGQSGQVNTTLAASLLVQAKFLAGWVDYTPAELEELKKWISPKKQQMRDYFLQHIIKERPSQKSRYKSSSLAIILET